MIYLDSSALVKLIITEPESRALARWLAERADLPMVSSIVHRAEVPRAVWRADPGAFPRSYRQVRGVERIALTPAVLDAATSAPPPSLRTLEAIHLASALSIRRDLTEFVAYDKRLLDAARSAGLPTASPG